MEYYMNSRHRGELIQKIKDNEFDLLIIGGGVTGAGIALDAASRGLKTILIEKNDFASGTSSKSTKLIHGGLRYLKQLELKLVMETGRERAIVHNLIPNLVKPRRMILPIREDGTYSMKETSLALRVYDILADVEYWDRKKMLTPEQTLKEEPLLREDGLVGSGFYVEYLTDDARLTIELIKTAGRNNGLALNYAEAIKLNYKDGKIQGASVKDQFTDETFDIKAKCVVSACGPWVDEVRKLDKSLEGKKLLLSKGVHIVLPYYLFPLEYSVYFDEPDGRMIFAIPRGRVTYIGTTDTVYNGDKENLRVTIDEVEYLLNAANKEFPSINLKIQDVISSWAGLRPLIHEEGKDPSEVSRKDEIFYSKSGLISIAGGKLTGYRKMAKRTVNKVFRHLKIEWVRCKTKRIKLTKSVFKDYEHQSNVEFDCVGYAAADGLLPYYGEYLIQTYGIIGRFMIYMNKSQDINPEVRMAVNETHYCLKYENIQTLCDFIIRRTGRLYFDFGSIRVIRDHVCKVMAEHLGWDEERIKQENAALDKEIERATVFVLED